MPGPNAPYTKLDHQQVLTHAFDETTDRLRVDASVTAEVSSMEISADVSDIAIEDRISGNQLAVEADGSINANVVLDASSDTVRLSDGTNLTNVTAANALKVDASHTTQPVSAIALPLPSGAATNAAVLDLKSTRMRIVESNDVVAAYTFSDFGLATERLASVVYTSATYAGTTVTKTFSYTNVGGSYRLDSVTWTVV